MSSVLTLRKSILTLPFVSFGSSRKSYWGKSRTPYSEMCSLSAPIPHVEGSASEHELPGDLEKVKAANEFPGYRPSMNKEDDVRKSPLPISDNVTSRAWMSRDLSIYSNSRYAYANLPSAVDLFWDQGGREIAHPKPLPMIFTITTHCLDATATNNYFVRAQCRWFFLDTMLKGSFPPWAR